MEFRSGSTIPWEVSSRVYVLYSGRQSVDGVIRGFLGTAMRRFGHSRERYRVDDKIIDLLIAAEALFLSQGSYTAEISYRLSQRAALFLATGGQARQNVFRRMRAAYSLRSAVAHGGRYPTHNLPKMDDGTVPTVDDFVWQIQEYIRIAIIKAVQIANQHNSPAALVDWDELMFGSS